MALSKVFRIEMQGTSDVSKSVTGIKKAITDMGKAIASTKEQLANLLNTKGDNAQVADLTQKLGQLTAAYTQLKQKQVSAETSLRDQAAAEKLLAQAERERIKSQIDQEKELDRQIDREAKLQKQQEKSRKTAEGLAGSYNQIKASLAQLKPFVQSGGIGGTIAFNGQNLNFEQAIAQFTQLSFAEQAFRRQFQADGTLVSEYSAGIVKAFRELNIDDLIKNNINGAKEQITQLEEKTKSLVVAYRQAQQEGSADMNKLEKEIHDTVKETSNLKVAVGQAETQLRGIGGTGVQITESINKGFKNLTTTIGQYALTYFGFQAVFSGLQGGVDIAKELADQTSNLEVELGKAKGGATNLVNELAKLDTRTKLTGLEDIANIAAKAGVSENNLVGVVQAIDKIKISFGKDFGDVETGTESLVKLVNIFLGPSQVTGENILKMGNAIRTLANESVASVPFLNDFAKRMAGLKGISDISLPAVLGLASGFEQFGQTAEVSGTALVRIIPKLATDTEKFAKIAGVTNKEFKDLINNNPAEALLKISEGLVKGKSSIEEITSNIIDSGISPKSAARITSVLGVLGKNADTFRKSIASAGEAFSNTTNIETAFTAKNENLAGTLDKISKKFADAANSQAFQTALKATSALVLLLLNNIPGLITILSLLAVSWAVQNAQLLLLRGSMIIYNLLIARNYIALAALTVIQTAYNTVLFIMNGAITIGTRLMALFGLTVRATSGPLGIILTLATLLGTALLGLSQAMGNASTAISDHTRKLQLLKQIHDQASAAIADTKAKLAGYASVVQDTTISEGARLRALKDLIAIDPAFSQALKGNKIDMNAFNDILKEVNENLIQKADLEAAQTTQQASFKEVERLKTIKENLEIAKKLKKGFGDLTDEEQAAFSKITTVVGNTAFTSSLLNSRISDSDYGKAFKSLDAQIANESKTLDLSTSILKEKYQKTADTINNGKKTVANADDTDTGDLSLGELETKLKGINNEIKQMDLIKNKTDLQLKKLKELRAQRAEIIREIKELGGTVPGDNRGSRLTGAQKDDFKDIDAIRDTLLSEQKELFLNLQIDEKTYLGNVLKINTAAANEKLKLIKGTNAQERKVIADLNLEKVSDLQETNKKLFELDNQQLENQLTKAQQFQKNLLEDVDQDASTTNQEKSDLKQQIYDNLLLMQLTFNKKQSDLEKKYGIQSVKNEQDRQKALEDIARQGNLNDKNGPLAILKDIQDQQEIAVDKIKQQVAQQTVAILDSKESYYKKAKAIDALQKKSTVDVLQAEVDAQKKTVAESKIALDQKLISQKDYNNQVTALKEKEAALDQATTDAQITNTQLFIKALKSLKDQFAETFLGIKQYTDDAAGRQEKAADAIKSAAATINTAINSASQAYFQNEQDRVDVEKQDHLDALDRDKERVESLAKSDAEKDTIDRQYDQKAKQIEKKASEDKRKIALKEAAINFAVAVVKTFAQFGFPLGLIPVAALTLAYGLQRATINKQQFAGGGKVLPNGLINERPNISPQKNGDNVLATVRTGEVLLNQQQQRALGGPSVFRRIGVPGFAGGGLVTAPQLGVQLRAPNFSSSFTAGQNSVTTSDLNELKNMVAQVASAVYATDKKPVILNPKTVTKSQTRTRRDVGIGKI